MGNLNIGAGFPGKGGTTINVHVPESVVVDPKRDGILNVDNLPVWYVSLNNEQTEALEDVLKAGGGSFAVAAAAAPPAAAVFGTISVALLAAIPIIKEMNKLGGHNGVDINGVIGTLGLIVTPRIGKIYGDLINAARLAVKGRTIIDFMIFASTKVPALSAALKIGAVASIVAAVESGTPLGWAIAGTFGVVMDILKPEPDPNEHGAVVADRNQVGPWETFHLGQLGEGNKVALLSHMGCFSAQQGGGQGVYANRPWVKEWETWTLIDNNDGTVSFQTIGGHFLCAENGGDSVCQANRVSIGNWEKFILVNLPDGRVALKTHDKGKFVSVQP